MRQVMQFGFQPCSQCLSLVHTLGLFSRCKALIALGFGSPQGIEPLEVRLCTSGTITRLVVGPSLRIGEENGRITTNAVAFAQLLGMTIGAFLAIPFSDVNT